MQISGRSELVDAETLAIYYLKVIDSGKYTCVVSSSTALESRDFNLTVNASTNSALVKNEIENNPNDNVKIKEPPLNLKENLFHIPLDAYDSSEDYTYYEDYSENQIHKQNNDIFQKRYKTLNKIEELKRNSKDLKMHGSFLNEIFNVNILFFSGALLFLISLVILIFGIKCKPRQKRILALIDESIDSLSSTKPLLAVQV